MLAGEDASSGAERTLSRVLAANTLVGVVIGALIIPAIIWFLDAPPPTELVGKHGVIVGLTMGAFFQVLGTGIAVTLALRRQVRRGSLHALASETFPWAASLPRNWALRALLLTAFAMALLVPVGLAICAMLHVYPLSKPQYAAFNSLYGALIAILITPVIAVAALSDR
jgi:hypothetical protein